MSCFNCKFINGSNFTDGSHRCKWRIQDLSDGGRTGAPQRGMCQFGHFTPKKCSFCEFWMFSVLCCSSIALLWEYLSHSIFFCNPKMTIPVADKFNDFKQIANIFISVISFNHNLLWMRNLRIRKTSGNFFLESLVKSLKVRKSKKNLYTETETWRQVSMDYITYREHQKMNR